MTTIKAYCSFILFLTMLPGTIAMAYEQAYAKTDVGQIEILDLPAARLIESEMEGSYFQNSGGLFSKLFDYIRANEISMTVPVEGDIDQAKMRFYVGTDVSSTIEDTESVRIVNTAARTVVSIGAKGAYNEKNIMKAKASLDEWMQNQGNWIQSGEAYAVFWNGPFTPWFMKRFDIHIPVRSLSHETTAAK